MDASENIDVCERAGERVSACRADGRARREEQA